jgi:hypothetical protein
VVAQRHVRYLRCFPGPPLLPHLQLIKQHRGWIWIWSTKFCSSSHSGLYIRTSLNKLLVLASWHGLLFLRPVTISSTMTPKLYMSDLVETCPL